eukprot:TRINITY_DN1584_c0_g1_i1.p1 TRINITY_DN1584_c0_g1~~TRINITY_DN1584_c0_g1_i1.p1  ORF type:complete len:391 (+),score=67.33 TRINITY_DN1584_c0_g1_i1:122-1294(+)
MECSPDRLRNQSFGSLSDRDRNIIDIPHQLSLMDSQDLRASVLNTERWKRVELLAKAACRALSRIEGWPNLNDALSNEADCKQDNEVVIALKSLQEMLPVCAQEAKMVKLETALEKMDERSKAIAMERDIAAHHANLLMMELEKSQEQLNSLRQENASLKEDLSRLSQHYRFASEERDLLMKELEKLVRLGPASESSSSSSDTSACHSLCDISISPTSQKSDYQVWVHSTAEGNGETAPETVEANFSNSSIREGRMQHCLSENHITEAREMRKSSSLKQSKSFMRDDSSSSLQHKTQQQEADRRRPASASGRAESIDQNISPKSNSSQSRSFKLRGDTCSQYNIKSPGGVKTMRTKAGHCEPRRHTIDVASDLRWMIEQHPKLGKGTINL